ncbi:hypothetical protein V2J09_002346 [Rumex salicifolius]
MSASTVSITANPAAATRRRAVVASEKKRSNLELVNDGIASPLVDNNALSGGAGVVGDKTTGGSNKDLSHSIRGESVLERSKDLLQKKPSQPSSTVSPRRTRKLASLKSEKARWQTVLSVFTKNLLLLFFLAGLIQMVRKLVIDSESDGSVNLTGFSEMEGRIADVETYIKTTTQILQYQLEAADKKLKGEISSLRSEMDSKFEKNSEDLASRLKILDAKYEVLEKALGQLNSKELLSKEDFTRLYEEFSKSEIGNMGQSELSLDEIRGLARQIVEKEIDKHAADGLGRVDYALGTGGATVLKHSEPFVVGKGGKWLWQGVQSDADKMLKPSFGEPGQCFPLKGSSGFVQIKLRTAIVPEAVTLEHVAKSVAYDRSSAPRDCRVFGWLQGKQGADTESSVDGENTLLTEFSYDLDKSNAQTYNVLDSASSAVVDTIRFDFTSNHGSPSHTCIYRVRVHGHEPNLISHFDAVMIHEPQVHADISCSTVLHSKLTFGRDSPKPFLDNLEQLKPVNKYIYESVVHRKTISSDDDLMKRNSQGFINKYILKQPADQRPLSIRHFQTP